MKRRLNRAVACLAAGILVAVGSFIGWQVMFPPAIAHFAAVLDRSDSPAFAVCDALSSIVRRELALPHVVKESQLTLIATGDAGNDFQGRLVKRSPLPKKVAAIRSEKKQALREQAYVDDLSESCKALKKVDRSPILYAISAAVADLRAQGCRAGAGCRVDVASDGNETVDPVLAAALKGDERAAQQLVPVVDNRGIEIAFCGLTQAPRRPGAKPAPDAGDRIGRVRRLWSARFTDPNLVSATPFCLDGAPSSAAVR